MQALTILVLIEKATEGSNNPLLQPWALLAVSTICGFVVLFRCRNWLDGYRTDSSAPGLLPILRSKVCKLMVLLTILAVCQIWIGLLYDIN